MHPFQSHHWMPARRALIVVFCLALLAAFGPARLGAAQALPGFALVTDFGDTLYPGSSLSLGGALSFTGAVVAGPNTFFQAFTPDAGAEIWRSDGTEAGTFLLKDTCSGADDQFPVPTLTAIGATIYFPADDCVSGRELWKSDGTPAGTQRVKDINPGPDRSSPDNFFVAAGQLFFTADQATSTIWKSDGTDSGTISTGAAGTPIFVLGNGLFFTSFAGGACSIKRLDATTNSVSDLAPFCPRSIHPNGFGGISIAAGPT
jgi:ELWxxDGT repeat protein